MELETINKLYLELSQFATAKTARELELEELLRSAHAIAERQGAGTKWDRFAASLAAAGISAVTARTYRILPSDTEPAMAKSLHESLAEIGKELVRLGHISLSDRLIEAIVSHPPADGVVVPRELLANLRDAAAAHSTTFVGCRWAAFCEQADAILAQKE